MGELNKSETESKSGHLLIIIALFLPSFAQLLDGTFQRLIACHRFIAGLFFYLMLVKHVLI
jgi:hypothetical protein